MDPKSEKSQADPAEIPFWRGGGEHFLSRLVSAQNGCGKIEIQVAPKACLGSSRTRGPTVSQGEVG